MHGGRELVREFVYEPAEGAESSRKIWSSEGNSAADNKGRRSDSSNARHVRTGNAHSDQPDQQKPSRPSARRSR